MTRATAAAMISLGIRVRHEGVADVDEGVEDERSMSGGVEAEEAAEEVVEILLREYLLLHDHLHHGLPKILIRILRLLHHRYALFDLIGADHLLDGPGRARAGVRGGTELGRREGKGCGGVGSVGG